MPKAARKKPTKLVRLGVKSTAITLAAVYAILGCIYSLIYLVAIAFFGLSAIGLRALFLVLLFPVFFAIMGFIGGSLTAFAYNFVAKYTGGISFEVSG